MKLYLHFLTRLHGVALKHLHLTSTTQSVAYLASCKQNLYKASYVLLSVTVVQIYLRARKTGYGGRMQKSRHTRVYPKVSGLSQ
jgi:hypothetical protein